MGIRLSNLIFSIAVFALFIYLQKSKREILNLVVLTSFFASLIYGLLTLAYGVQHFHPLWIHPQIWFVF